MSDTKHSLYRNFTRALKVGAAAFAMSTVLTPVPTKAEPITTAIFGSAFAATFAGGLVSTVISAGVSFVGGQIINWIWPPNSNSSESTSNTTPNPMEVKYGDRVARGAWFGMQPIGGHWVHANEYANATELQLVYILADGWSHINLGKMIIDGRSKAIIPVSPTNNASHEYRVDGYGEKLRIRIHDGRPGQLADTNLIVQTPGWTAAKKYSNMAYAVVELTSDRDLYSGIPEFVFAAAGLRCYDPRKDGSMPGGSGAHRFDNPTTWEYTTNPAVQAYHYSRGFYFNGQRVLGAGYRSAQLDFDYFVTAMNICDQTVSIPGGGTRKRYECHTAFDDTESYGSVMDRLCQAMGGRYGERQGRVTVFAGAIKSSVLTITDGSLIKDAEITWNQKRAGETLYAAIQGTYVHPTDYYSTPYTALFPPEFVYSGMEPKVLDVNFSQVQHPHQAYLLAKMMLYRNNLQSSATVTLDIKDLLVEVGDWVRWDSEDYAIGDRYYEVVTTGYDFKKMRITLGLEEISDAVFADDSTAADIAVPDRDRPITVYITQTTNLEVNPTTVLGTDGSQMPALRITYDPILDAAVSGVKVAYRVVGTTTPVKYSIDVTPMDGLFHVSDFVGAALLYEVSTQLQGLPGREYPWSAWVEASDMTAEQIVAKSLSTDAFDSVDLDSFDTDVQNYINFSGAQLREVIQEIRDLQFWVAEQDAGQVIQFQVQKNDITASYTQSIKVVATETKALAVRLEELQVQVDEDIAAAVDALEASISILDGQVTAQANAITALSAATSGGDVNSANFRMSVLTGPTGYSRIGLETRQGGVGAWRGASTWWDTPNNPALPTRIVNLADQFILTDGSNMENPFVFSGGVAVMNASRINVVEAGLLRSFDGLSFWNLNTGAFRIST